jgi:hypothetical protein
MTAVLWYLRATTATSTRWRRRKPQSQLDPRWHPYGRLRNALDDSRLLPWTSLTYRRRLLVHSLSEPVINVSTLSRHFSVPEFGRHISARTRTILYSTADTLGPVSSTPKLQCSSSGSPLYSRSLTFCPIHYVSFSYVIPKADSRFDSSATPPSPVQSLCTHSTHIKPRIIRTFGTKRYLSFFAILHQ